MKNKLVRDVMQIGVPACRGDTPLTVVAQMLSEEERDILVVMGDDCMEGVVSQSDLTRAFLGDYKNMTARDVMTPTPYGVPPDIPLVTAVEEMLAKQVHQLLVIPESPECAAPVGVLSKHHLVELMAE